MTATMADLLCAGELDQVLQGLELVAAMDSAEVEAEILGRTVLTDLPALSFESFEGETRSRIRCLEPDGLLASDGFFTHTAALVLLIRHVRRCPSACAPKPGQRRVQLVANPAGGFFAIRELELSSGSLVYRELSTSFTSAAALLEWLQGAPDWQPQTIASHAMLVEQYGQELLRQVPLLHRGIPSPLREHLFAELTALCDGGNLCLSGLPIDALPDWVDLSRLASLDITGTNIRRISGDLSGITLILDAAQWAEWRGPLAVDALRLEGIADGIALRRLPPLRLLALSFGARIPAQLLQGLKHVESLELSVTVDQPVPEAVWTCPVRHLSLDGFFSVCLTGAPQERLESLTIAEDCLQETAQGWRPLLRPSMRHEVWLLGFAAVIPLVTAVRDLNGMGLRDARALVESAPCLITRTESNRAAHQIRRQLSAAGGQVVLR